MIIFYTDLLLEDWYENAMVNLNLLLVIMTYDIQWHHIVMSSLSLIISGGGVVVMLLLSLLSRLA